MKGRIIRGLKGAFPLLLVFALCLAGATPLAAQSFKFEAFTMPSLPKGADEAEAGGEVPPDGFADEVATARPKPYMDAESGKAPRTDGSRENRDRIVYRPITTRIDKKPDVQNGTGRPIAAKGVKPARDRGTPNGANPNDPLQVEGLPKAVLAGAGTPRPSRTQNGAERPPSWQASGSLLGDATKAKRTGRTPAVPAENNETPTLNNGP